MHLSCKNMLKQQQRFDLYPSRGVPGYQNICKALAMGHNQYYRFLVTMMIVSLVSDRVDMMHAVTAGIYIANLDLVATLIVMADALSLSSNAKLSFLFRFFVLSFTTPRLLR